MTNAEWMVNNGYKFNALHCFVTSCIGDYVIFVIFMDDKYVGKVTDFSAFTALEKWLDMEHKDPEELGL